MPRAWCSSASNVTILPAFAVASDMSSSSHSVVFAACTSQSPIARAPLLPWSESGREHPIEEWGTRTRTVYHSLPLFKKSYKKNEIRYIKNINITKAVLWCALVCVAIGLTPPMRGRRRVGGREGARDRWRRERRDSSS